MPRLPSLLRVCDAKALPLAAPLLCAVVFASGKACGFEKLARCIGIGHGPGYHANDCPGCCRSRPPAQVYPHSHGTIPPRYPGAAPCYEDSLMLGEPQTADIEAPPVEPIMAPPADDGDAASSRRASGATDIELAPGEVLLEAPHEFDPGRVGRPVRSSSRASESQSPASRTFRSSGYGVPVSPGSASGSVPARTYGGLAIGYAPSAPVSQRPRTVAGQVASRTRQPELAERAVSRPMPVPNERKLRSSGPVIDDPVARSHESPK